MRLPMLLSILLASACSALPNQKTASPSITSAADPFPAATAGIQVTIADGADMKLQKLLDDFSKVTGVALLMDAETRSDVSKSSTGLNRSIDVPASEVYSVVETILLQHGFALIPVHDRDPRIASLVSINQSGNRQVNLRSSACFVSARDLESYSRHPAILITTSIDLPHTDVRTLSNAMRTMFTDANTQQIIPAGNTNTLILTGFAGTIVNTVRILQLAEESSAKAAAEEEKRRADIESRHGGPPPVPGRNEPPNDEKPKQ
jgi:general secretion pathway protein D